MNLVNRSAVKTGISLAVTTYSVMRETQRTTELTMTIFSPLNSTNETDEEDDFLFLLEAEAVTVGLEVLLPKEPLLEMQLEGLCNEDTDHFPSTICSRQECKSTGTASILFHCSMSSNEVTFFFFSS